MPPPGQTRRSLSKEFKADAVVLVLDGNRTEASVTRDLGIGETNLGNWIRQARIDRGDKPGLTTAEQAELVRLRRERAKRRSGARDSGLGMGGAVPCYWWVAACKRRGVPGQCRLRCRRDEPPGHRTVAGGAGRLPSWSVRYAGSGPNPAERTGRPGGGRRAEANMNATTVTPGATSPP